MLVAYRRLMRNRAFVRLLAGETISSVGDWLYLVAVIVVVYQVTQDALILGIVGAVRMIPSWSSRCPRASSPTATTGAASCCSPMWRGAC